MFGSRHGDPISAAMPPTTRRKPPRSLPAVVCGCRVCLMFVHVPRVCVSCSSIDRTDDLLTNEILCSWVENPTTLSSQRVLAV